jgi:hypothetical protein
MILSVQSFRLKAYIDAAKCRVVQDHLAVFEARTKPFVGKQSEIFKLLPSCFTPTCLEFSPPVWLVWVVIIRFPERIGLHILVGNTKKSIVRQMDHQRLAIRPGGNELG